MPRGGKRSGSGRKPKPLAEKLADGNVGHRPITKLDLNLRSSRPKLPEYYKNLENRAGELVPIDKLFDEIVDEIESTGCLNLVPTELIVGYAVAKYRWLEAESQLTKTAMVTRNSKQEYEMTDFAKVELFYKKSKQEAWSPIWEIVVKNSEKAINNPEEDFILSMMQGRVRRKRGSESGHENSENSDQ
jgi:hypothetical protein